MILLYRLFYSRIINILVIKLIKLIGKGNNKKWQIPVHGEVTLDIFDTGKTLKLRGNVTSPFTKRVYWNGIEDFEFTKIFVELIMDARVFFDIGANIGYYSMLAGILSPETKVFSFEPSRGVYFFLQENVRINNLKNVTVNEIALSDTNGEVKFFEERNPKFKYIEHHLSGIGNTQNTWNLENNIEYPVHAIRLDDYFEKEGIQHLDIMKIDTEGTEHHILKYAKSTIEKCKPIIICEVLMGKVESEIEMMVRDLGYLMFHHSERGLEKRENLFRKQDDGERNFFFVHPDKIDTISKYVCE